MNILKTIELYILKRVNCMIYELYLNKGIIKIVKSWGKSYAMQKLITQSWSSFGTKILPGIKGNYFMITELIYHTDITALIYLHPKIELQIHKAKVDQTKSEIANSKVWLKISIFFPQ